MSSIYKFLLNWSEVWPIAIALTIFLFYKQSENVSLIVWMLLISLVLHFAATFISRFTYQLPVYLKNNNILYNLIAIIKTTLTSLYLLQLKQLKQYKYLKPILYLFIAFTIINFIFFESIFSFSSIMILLECSILLVFTLTFFLDSIIDDEIPLPLKHPAYFICAAIGVFESLNFFTYLFLFHAYDTSIEFGRLIMTISSYAFILYGLVISLAFYLNREKTGSLKFEMINEK